MKCKTSSIKTAVRLYEEGDFSASLSVVLKILENEPDNLRALELRASLLYIKNLLPESIRAYKELLRFYGSDDVMRLFALSSISRASGFLKDYDNAIIYCEKSIELCERFLKIYSPQKDGFTDQLIAMLWNLGEYQRKIGNRSRAIGTYKRLLKLQCEFGCLEAITEALYELATAYYELNRTTEALSKFSEALKLFKGSDETFCELSHKYRAHYYVGCIHFADRDFKKALYHVEKCLLFIEEFYGRIDDADIEENFFYKKAKRLRKTLRKNKSLWKNTNKNN